MNEKKRSNNIKSTIGYHMINTSWQLKEALRKAFVAKGYDITADQFAVLMPLWEEEGITQIELCQRTCKNKSNLTRILDSMEKRNLITRVVGKQDRRSFQVFLTEEGKCMREPLSAIALQLQSQLFHGISEEESRLIADILDRINENLMRNKE